MEIATGSGVAHVEVDDVRAPSFLLVLTHGAAGGVDSPDLGAVRQAGLRHGGAVARVVQPYRVRGARAPGAPAKQDAAWLEVVGALRQRYPSAALIQGGRSNGARVACRTAAKAGAMAVIALAFPLYPPGRPDRSRAAELHGTGAQVLVINGDRDPFGVPAGTATVRVVVLHGETHALARRTAEIGRIAGSWLTEQIGIQTSPEMRALSKKQQGHAK